MWRYRELMPLFDGETPVTLGEGWTPLIHAKRLGNDARDESRLRQGRVAEPDQLLQGTGPLRRRDARVLSRREDAVGAVGRECRQRRRRLRRRRGHSRPRSSCRRTSRFPSFANVSCTVPTSRSSMASSPTPDASRPNVAGRSAGTTCRPSRNPTGSKARRRWATRSPSRWAGRCPTGSSIRRAAAPAWSACGRPSKRWSTSAGSTPNRRPKMVSVQAEHCAPIVRAFEQGAERSEMWQGARTVADGLRVPKAVGDFLVLRAVRRERRHRPRRARR